jgi:hypothetical protein
MVHASSKVTASPFLLAAGPTNTFSLTGVAKQARDAREAITRASTKQSPR